MARSIDDQVVVVAVGGDRGIVSGILQSGLCSVQEGKGLVRRRLGVSEMGEGVKRLTPP